MSSSASHASTKVDTIVFDLGGVLVDWNPRYLYRKLSDNEREIEDFLRDVCNSAWNEQQDAGRPFAEAVNALTPLHPDRADWIRAYHQRWHEMLAGPIQGTVDLLNQLASSKRVRLLALSNWSHETFPIARERFQFLNHFENILVSGDEKLIKPDARFFGLLESRFGVEPARALFIDDVQKNIDVARALGFQTFLFSNPQSLRQNLAQRGLVS